MTEQPHDPTREARAPRWAQAGDVLTTANGVPVDDTDNSLKVGPRGSTLLDDVHLREKIMRFDHERIPERVVHARGAAAHGHFRLHESLEDITCAQVLTDTSAVTPTFTRFSTVAGSRGSADTARDVRGFATKFYTQEGVWDLVGNNIPVFFIQDGIKFPDLIHAAKPEPDREIPQAQTAHDTFWDFASLATETTHMLLWIMSDRAIPRSFRMMQGFGVHTFRLVNAEGATTLVKFHWRPRLGTHSLVWEEAQLLAGADPDVHRRDLWDAIESGDFPEYDLAIQTFPDTEDQAFEGIDLLDPTKIVPEELAPLRTVGTLTLDRNPANFFAETEQVAFCTAHVVRGIDFTDDPLLAARNFSYFDTQLTRLGGPNFDQLPINRSASPVNTNERDGFSQQAVHEGVASYTPNSVDGDRPVSPSPRAYRHVPRLLHGERVRRRPASFGDHFSQATLFWNSMSAVEQDHIVNAFSFELGKCERVEIRERMVGNLARVDVDLCRRVVENLGLPEPSSVPAPAGAAVSPALSQVVTEPGPVTGRLVGVLADDGVDGDALTRFQADLEASGAIGVVIGPRGGSLRTSQGGTVTVDKALMTTRSVEYDAVAVAGGEGNVIRSGGSMVPVTLYEAFRHHKTLVAWGNGVDLLTMIGLPVDAPGVVTAAGTDSDLGERALTALGLHRHWARDVRGY